MGGVEGVRIIPALAGNTLPRHHRGGGERDHPRSRGEYLPRGARSGRPGGSSPLSRGIRGQSSCWPKSFRIIPALAGNTSSPRPPAHGGTDHPRSRGEYVTDKVNGRLHAGSSPLSRGIRPVPGRFAATPWIIPALAGNTWGGPGRMVGGGSSPLSRGIRPRQRKPIPVVGIIPALAGNTCLQAIAGGSSRDHPRSRGEYRLPHWRHELTPGSSPLSRGILRIGNNWQ